MIYVIAYKRIIQIIYLASDSGAKLGYFVKIILYLLNGGRQRNEISHGEIWAVLKMISRRMGPHTIGNPGNVQLPKRN